MKTTIHLVRHGLVYNPDKIFYGRIPGFFLSDEGQEQVKRLGSHLSQKTINTIYASPLDRTHQTAKILHTFFPSAKVIYDERLLEIYSPVEGKPFSEIEAYFFNFYQEPLLSQGGEAIEMVAERMMHFFEDIKKKHPGEEVVVVSHGDPIMITWKKHALGMVTIEDIRGKDYIDTATGITFEFDGENHSLTRITPKP